MDSRENRFGDIFQQLNVRAYRQAKRRIEQAARGMRDLTERSDVDRGWVDEDDLRGQMEEAVKPALTADAVASAETAAALLGTTVDPSAVVWTEVAEARFSRLVASTAGRKGVVQAIAEDTGKAVAAGFQAGESTGQIAARVAQTLGVTPGNVTQVGQRALTIARTEANGLANEISMRLFDVAPQVTRKRWYSIGDSRTRDSHQAVNGQEIAFNERFNVNGHLMAHPHDPSAPASETVNCRCRLIPVVEL